jgi:hypothetical protein
MNQRWLAILLFGIGVGLGGCSDDGGDGGGDGGGGDDTGGGTGGTSGTSGTSGTGGSSGAGVTGGTGGSSADLVQIYCQLEDATGAVRGCDQHSIPEAAADASREGCTAAGGTVVDECPSEGRIGQCSLEMGAVIFNYYEPDDPAELETLCTGLGGTWTAA